MTRKEEAEMASKLEYPVTIKTKEGEINTGWSEGQRSNDILLIGTFTEEIANCLIKLNDLYERHQPAAALQFQMNLMLNFIKAQKQNIRAYRKTYESHTK